jgi:hypothetical protein
MSSKSWYEKLEQIELSQTEFEQAIVARMNP